MEPLAPQATDVYADVLIDSIPLAQQRPYTYRVPAAMRDRVRVGSAVVVPFGPKQRVSGYVVAYPARAPQGTARDIRELLGDTIVPPALQRLFQWVADYYLCTVAQVYQMALPRGTLNGTVKEKTQLVVTLQDGLTGDLSKRQMQVIGVLTGAGGQMTLADLVRAAQTTPGLLRTLEAKGAIAIATQRIWRAPELPNASRGAIPEPTPEQSEAIAAIKAGEPGEVFLLHGVTGSGKTEVYLQTIAETLERREQALVLVPEIALTPQTVARFRARFGDRIAVLHSALGEGERFDEWQRLRNGDAQVGIGARSAVFAPLARLGLIILDEEHEGSYKQDNAPRYHARDVALQRAAFEGARVVLGSATPSVESYRRAEQGDYRLLTLTERVNARPLPPVEVVDMRAELEAGHRSIFSRSLTDALHAHLGRGEQAILLINRRGYSSFVMCRSCGEPVRCPNCSVSLTYHKAGEALRCHYCDHHAAPPERCPSCRSPYIKHFGAGTQQVAEAAAALLPEARIMRLDRDTTTRKGSHQRILDAFAAGEGDVLIGTQMVAKGLDLQRVSLVGVMAADASLNLPDFRAAERSFQLLTQVAGRAGRGEIPGRVIVQTYAPDHPSVRAAQVHDFTAFYTREIVEREELRYPPFQHLINVVVSAEDSGIVWKVGEALADRLLAFPELMALGPAEAPLFQLRGRYRVQVLIKTPELPYARNALREAVRQVERPQGVRLAIDVEPHSLL
ncbi:primosomal protein N' [bacterium]|nr:primosomal protein N' [bacterium]